MKIISSSQAESLIEAYDDFWLFLISHSISDIVNDSDLTVEYGKRMERLDHCFKRVFGGMLGKTID